MEGNTWGEKRLPLVNYNFTLFADSKCFSFSGSWELRELPDPEHLSFPTFDFVITLNHHNYLAHPDDLSVWKDVVAQLQRGQSIHVSVRVISQEQKVYTLEATGYIKLTKEDEQKINQGKDLLQSIIDAPALGLAVYKAVRDREGKIKDFVYEFINKTTHKTLGKDFTGKLLSDYGQQGSMQLDNFIKVIETGVPLSYVEFAEYTGSGHWLAFTNSPLGGDRLLHMWEDVTIQKKADNEVLKLKDQLAERAEEKYRQLFNSINQGFCITEIVFDADGKPLDLLHLEANPVYQKMIGLQDVTGKRLRDIIPDIGQEWIDLHWRVALTGEPERLEYYVRSVDRWFTSYASRVSGNGCLQVASVIDDVTEHKEGELLVQDVDDRYRELLERQVAQRTAELVKNYEILHQSEEVAEIGSWDYIIDTGEFTWSDGMHKLFSRPKNLPLQPEIYIDAIIPEDLEKAKRIVRHFRTDHQGFDEIIRIKPSGKIKTLKVKASVINDETGKPLRIIGVDLDISMLIDFEQENLRMHKLLAQQAENKYRLLFEAIDQGFAIVEMIYDECGNAIDYTFIETNPAFEKQTGMQQAVGKRVRDLRPAHEAHWFTMYGTIAKEQRPMRFVQSAQESEEHWYEVFAFPTDQPEKHCVAMLVNDITKRRQAEYELKKLYSDLQELDEAKTNFFGNVSHEFRTPLTLLLSPLRDLIETPSTPLQLQRDKLEMIQRNAHRLQKLVNTLLDFSRIEAGQRDAVFQPVDIVKYTTELASNFRSLIEDAGIKFVIKAEDPNEPVYLNPGMYEKVVLNLVSNAFKFTHKGTIQVAIKVKKKKVELQVSDTGIGIHPNHQKKIFERFSRLENRNARAFEGTGIGLALVKELVEMHAGTIMVKSTLGKGSRFNASFPRGKDHIPREKLYESKAVPDIYKGVPDYLEEMKGWIYSEGEGDLDGKLFSLKPVVLIADDNADMRAYLTTVLQNRFQVIRAASGKKALEILKSGIAPDAVVTDVMMPDMDGFELLARIKNDTVFRKIPVLMLSARADEETRIDGLRYGADDYLIKPFASHELLARVDARIQIARLQHELENRLLQTNEELEREVQQRTKAIQALNANLKQKNYQVEGVNKELTHLTFVTGQDLRGPLQRLTVYLKVLTHEQGFSPLVREVLNKMYDQTRALSTMLGALATYSGISAPARFTPTDMHVQWEFVKVSLGELISRSSAVVEGDVNGTLMCDPIQINLLLTQLVQSSILSWGTEPKPEVIVAGKFIEGEDIDHPRALKDRTYYALTVRYNGAREDESNEKIFQLLDRQQMDIDYPGTGIGLAVSRKIVETHGGFMVSQNWRNSRFGFSCYFPVETEVPSLV